MNRRDYEIKIYAQYSLKKKKKAAKTITLNIPLLGTLQKKKGGKGEKILKMWQFTNVPVLEKEYTR